MALNLCVSAKAPNVEYYATAFEKEIRSLLKSITFGSTPDDFRSIKQSNEKIIMFVEGPWSHNVIKDLCDDFTLSKDQRRVQWIYSLTAGVDVYRLGELTKELKDIPFMNGRGCYSSVLAEHVIYSMLYFNRKTWRLQANRAAHKWDLFNMIELRGQKLGIIGYGDIGCATGKLARAFGMDVTGVKRSPALSDTDEYGVKIVHGDAERDRVIRESDFVVGILPGTEETKGFFNKATFVAMKPSAVFINIGRGSTQCEKDLVEALRDGIISGAAVDVFEKEPLPQDSELWTFGGDKILLTPHTADRTADLVPSSVRRFVNFVNTYSRTNQLDGYRVDVSRGY